MTNEELVKLLQELSGGMTCGKHVIELEQAADRIEALTAENEALKKSGRALLNAKHKEAAEAKLWFEKGQALTAENFKLAAGSCDVEGGKVGDEHGHFYCTLQAKIEALTAEVERLLVSNEQWQVDYNEAVIDKLELETKIKRLRGIGLHLVQHINWVTNGLPDLLEDACLTDEEGVINAAIAAATEARAALEKQP